MLIDEIEAAAATYAANVPSGLPEDGKWSSGILVRSPWWPRIKAALLAGREMEDCLDPNTDPRDDKEALRKWREAMK